MTYDDDVNLAVMTVESKWIPNKPLECLKCYGTSKLEHPAVQMVSMERGKYYIGKYMYFFCKCIYLNATKGGKIEGLNIPKRVFPCATPKEVRDTLPQHKDVLAFQCRNPIHRAHYELFTRALEADNVGEDAVCLVHPTCGPTQVILEFIQAFD